MGKGRNDPWQGRRKLLGIRDGYRCVYCRVPTAATVEHLQARSRGGDHDLDNLALACPYCNSKKGNRVSAEEFASSGGWKLAPPTRPLGDLRTMLATEFGWTRPAEGLVRTGTSNACLKLAVTGEVSLLVRAGADDQWVYFHLGPGEHPTVVARSYDFLVRHFTPPKPKPLPGRLFVKGKTRKPNSRR